MKHELMKLPFDKGSLAPYISAETLQFHYEKHHAGYVKKLNELIVGTDFENHSLEDIVKKSTGPIFNNASQVWNHDFYWHSLTPKSSKPQGELLHAIEASFGSFEEFKTKFNQAAVGQFGSGWAWLVRGPAGKLAIETTSNAENPLHLGKKALLTCDVWEHAYYVDYRNERAKYLESIWSVMNWDFAAKNFAQSA